MSQDADDPPVAGRNSLVKLSARSKWSRRGRKMRSVLLTVWKVVAMIVAAIRSIRWLFENL